MPRPALDDGRLVVAGPDATARLHESRVLRPVTAVRLHVGLGPVLLGVPAAELTDRTVPLDALWGDRRARELASRVDTDPATALGRWATTGPPPDPLGARLVALLGAGRTVAAAADALGFSARQLHRRALPLFGYGPQHLARVLRLQRAVALADRGDAWAGVAAHAGYADQAHLARDVRALAGTTPTALRRERRVRSVQDAA